MSQKSSCCKASVTPVHRPGLSCSTCSLYFHYKCVNLDKANYIDCLENTTVSWSCQKCIKSKKSRRSTIIPASLPINSTSVTATPSTSSFTPTPSTSKVVKSSGKTQIVQATATTTSSTNFEQLTANLREIREANQESFKQLKDLIDQLCKRIENLEKLREAVDTLKQTSVELETKTSNNERKLLENSIEIQGIPHTSEPTETTLEIGIQINSPLSPTDIKKCYFKEVSTNNAKKLLLIVEFHSNSVKKNFVLRGKVHTRSQKKFSYQEEQVTIHINDQLSSYQKKLLFETKALAKTHKFEFVWISNGQILVRKSFGLQPHCIRSFDDLDNLVQL